MAEYNWPYPDEFGQTETVDSDILVLGGGLAAVSYTHLDVYKRQYQRFG